jgi:anthranilate/para-aminobenzoate synthase component I
MISPADLFKRAAHLPGVAFLDGRAARPGAARSIVAWSPETTLAIDGSGVARIDGEPVPHDPLSALDEFLEREAASERTVIGCVAYDLGRWVEPRSGIRATDEPIVYLSGYRRCHEFDHVAGCWGAPIPELPPAVEEPLLMSRPEPAIRRSAYNRSFARILEWIRAGDIYQANLSIPFDARISGSPTLLYERLAATNPVPYGACLDMQDHWLLANSPELFLARRGRDLITRPIKGTRRRGDNERMDRELRNELRHDPKERAEHVMIVDLERSDLGRIAIPGSVHVEPFEMVETYPTLHHLESIVKAKLPKGIRFSEILRATFPSGSITGAPKIRAMQILAEVEGESRGFYTGSVVHLLPNGDFTMNLCIRTATIQGDRLRYRAGGGLVVDSSADAEWAECLLKCRALFLAAEAK